jgi:hypothetical protein
LQTIIKKYQSEGRPREIAIKTAKIIYLQTPNEFGEEAVRHYKEGDSYQAPITRLLFTTYSNSDKASYQR